MKCRAFSGLIALLLTANAASAEAVDMSLRPVARGETRLTPADAPPEVEEEVVARAATLTPSALAPALSLRPTLRPAGVKVEALLSKEITGTQAGFRAWVKDFRPRALEQGIRAETFDRAFKDVDFDRKVVERDRNQSEFTKTIWVYLDSAASDARVRNGKAALRKNAKLLERIEADYGVQKEIVVAIWGLESAYGTFRGSTPVIQSMASLAYDARRAEFFEEQLIDALKILQQGDTTPDKLQGSWAGAMGHTQFMPGSFQRLAVDHNGDGRRNIWDDDPADALASTANYLKSNGWKTGVPWGVEVTLPKGFDYLEAKREVTRLPSAWARKGVVGLDGQPVKDFGQASVLLPAGHQGAAFLIFDNFEVIETYNTADAYVIGVGHLADRIAGGAPIKGNWPRADRALTFQERVELQKRLTAAGFDTEGIDAKIGPLTVEAVRNFQRSKGLVPDGYASPAILKRLR
ncbi:lytic murein transglycosylase [Antarctobacter sp.]|uniref:lytic murein transglycosylase n=1 Tax=Antarctobacter sp. TaxID=1872577 RepID=UPI003A90C49A